MLVAISLLPASLLLLASMEMVPSHACSNFVLNTSLYPGQLISARSMDFASFGNEDVFSPNFGLVAVRKGAHLPVFVVNGTADSGPHPRSFEEEGIVAKLDFYCSAMLLSQDILETFYLPSAQNGFGVCVDGINEASLSLNVHWDEMMGEIGAYRVSSNQTAINFLDLPTFVLSQFSSVDELLKDFPGPGKTYDLVINPLYAAASPSLLGESTKVHMMVTDASGVSAVLEWTNNTYDRWSFQLNPLGVLTNTPQLQAQYQMLDELEPKLEATCKDALANDYKEGPYSPEWNCEGVHKSFYGTGAWEAPDRFQRAVLLNRGLAGLALAHEFDGRFPSFIPWSPNFKNDSNRAALTTAMQILATLTIPGNIALGPQTWTQFTVLRDHKDLHYYIRPASAAIYSKYSLDDLKELPEGSVRFGSLKRYAADTPFTQKFHPGDLEQKKFHSGDLGQKKFHSGDLEQGALKTSLSVLYKAGIRYIQNVFLRLWGANEPSET